VTKISSKLTFANKRIFPILWFGSFAFVGGKLLVERTIPDQTIALLPLAIMAVFGFIVMRFFVWDLADAVYDCGDHLLVRKGNREARIPLGDVMNVNSTTMSNPSRVTLRLVRPCPLGSIIVFSPKANRTLNPFAKNAVAENLLERAYSARTKNGL
jgi:hypothetical protein